MRGFEQRARGQHDGEYVMQVVKGDADPRAEPMPVGGLADAGLDVQARAAEAEPWGRRADGEQKNMVGRCHIPSPMRGLTEKKIMPRASALGFAAGTHRALTEGGGPR